MARPEHGRDRLRRLIQAAPALPRDRFLDKGNIGYAAGKGASVRRLHRTNIHFQHAGGIQTPRPLFSIISGVLTTESD